MEVQILHQQTKEFIFSLQASTISKVIRSSESLEKFGHELGMPQVRQLGQGLFELRIHRKQEVRLLFVFRCSRVIILHGFVKKSMQIPLKELRLARTRIEAFDRT